MQLIEATYGATIAIDYENKKIELKYSLDENDSLSSVRDIAHEHFKTEAKALGAKGSMYLK